VHPFIELKKEILTRYAKIHSITHYTDISNEDISYTRNRYRHVLIPLLLKENPNLHETINTYHKDLTAYESLLKDLASQFLSTQSNAIDYKAFTTLNILVQRYILKTLISEKIGEKHAISSAMIDRVLTMLSESKGNFTYPLSDKVDLHKSYDTIFIAKSMQKTAFCLTITKEGLYQTDKDIAYFVTHENLTHLYSKYTVLWYNDKVFPLYIRNRRNGDKIHKSFGTKKIKDLFIDKKVPPHVRDEHLLLANDKEVLWIPFLNEEKDHERSYPNKLYVYEVL
jgi:tRNA(Ile)-lysidine synthetase-like protein